MSAIVLCIQVHMHEEDIQAGRLETTLQEAFINEVLPIAKKSIVMPPANNALIAPAATHDKLAPREREVLVLVASGQTQKEVARTMGISPFTVVGYKKEIYRKLDISTVAEATQYAIKNGLLSVN